ncbi:MAG: IS3 family transposase, partial [Erysipelotrichaceae bacterium]
VIHIFKDSKNNYGTRKIKVILEKKNLIASRAKIGQIMKKYGLVSNYTTKQFKVKKSTCNNDKVENLVNREFNDRDSLDVVISDLTYV